MMQTEDGGDFREEGARNLDVWLKNYMVDPGKFPDDDDNSQEFQDLLKGIEIMNQNCTIENERYNIIEAIVDEDTEENITHRMAEHDHTSYMLCLSDHITEKDLHLLLQKENVEGLTPFHRAITLNHNKFFLETAARLPSDDLLRLIAPSIKCQSVLRVIDMMATDLLLELATINVSAAQA